MVRSALEIATTWHGDPLEPAEQAVVRVVLEDGAIAVTVAAPFVADPAPLVARGRTERLWEHEVVEVFFAESATRGSRYLELELGPHGHWLAFGFASYRALTVSDIAVTFEASIVGTRWAGQAHIAAPEVARAVAAIGAMNAYAIRGVGAARRYMAAWPAPNGAYPGPDFHRTEYFK